MKANSLQNEDYATYGEFKVQVSLILTGIALVVLLIVVLLRRWIRKYRKRSIPAH